jgi:hypothetical protein
MNKKQKVLICIIVLIVLTILGFKGYNKIKSDTPTENVFINAMDNVSIEYLTYGDYSNQCLLLITNNNDFQINLAGNIEKEDENGVKNKNWDDQLNININPKQTYVIETVNPNNKDARLKREPITFNANSLTISPVIGSDESGSKSEQLLLHDYITYEISMEKLNDSHNPLIKITNKSEHSLNVLGYIIFYEDKDKKQISSVVEMEVYDIPGNGVYKDYLSLRASSEELEALNYDVYINICE